MRLVGYILAWLAINIILSMAWVYLETGPSVAFILGMIHGGATQCWLLGKYTRVW